MESFPPQYPCLFSSNLSWMEVHSLYSPNTHSFFQRLENNICHPLDHKIGFKYQPVKRHFITINLNLSICPYVKRNCKLGQGFLQRFSRRNNVYHFPLFINSWYSGSYVELLLAFILVPLQSKRFGL